MTDKKKILIDYNLHTINAMRNVVKSVLNNIKLYIVYNINNNELSYMNSI